MTMIITGGTVDYDGSGAPITAGGAVIVTFSGTKTNQVPVMTMYSRSDSAAFTPIFQTSAFRRFKVNLATSDEYYFMVTVPNGAVVDLAVTPV